MFMIGVAIEKKFKNLQHTDFMAISSLLRKNPKVLRFIQTLAYSLAGSLRSVLSFLLKVVNNGDSVLALS